MRGLVRTAVVVTLISVGSGWASHANGGVDKTKRACFPRGTTTLLQNRVARVYRQPRTAARFACAYSRGEVKPIDSPTELVYGYPPPALDLDGTVAVTAADYCPPDGECSTGIDALDLARPPETEMLRVIDASPPPRFRAVKVGSLRVRNMGDTAALAWIACPERGNSEGTPRPNCVRPGDKDYVLVLGSRDRRPRIVDSGRTIDPSSLRRAGDRVTWRKGERLSSAPLR